MDPGLVSSTYYFEIGAPVRFVIRWSVQNFTLVLSTALLYKKASRFLRNRYIAPLKIWRHPLLIAMKYEPKFVCIGSAKQLKRAA